MKMRVLWITNVLFPDICQYLGLSAPVTGGWMKSSANVLTETYHDNINIAVASVCENINSIVEKQIGKIVYYCIPGKLSSQKYLSYLEPLWKEVHDRFRPDIVHIHGTEFTHGLAYINANCMQNVVVSIQGLLNGIARYSLGQINETVLRKYRTLYDYLRSPLLSLPKRMSEQGRYENEYLLKINHVIGRTQWDMDHVWSINPECHYHFCNETLRRPFYMDENRWKISECERHAIFLSQASSPIKGLHKLIEALPLVIREFPDTKVYVSGTNFLKRDGFVNKLKYSTYANYVYHLMKRLNVENRFIFTGPLEENLMAQRYKAANIFICPSSIENSPNSLGEAQLIGTPCIASYVGGIPDMIEHGKTGFMYRFGEHEMLAKYICRIFSDDNLALNLSENARVEAKKRHDSINNARRTINIYRNIIEG